MSGHPSDGPAHSNAACIDHHERRCNALERYRSMLDGLQEVVFQTDAAGRWSYLNPAWTGIMGHGVAQALGTPFLDYVHSDDRARTSALFVQLIGGSKDRSGCKIHCVARDGTLRWIKVSVRSMLDEHGAIVGTLGTLTDITQRRGIEERLRLAASVFDGTSEGILITDPHGRIAEVNKLSWKSPATRAST
jgi:PAS domain S-box-containing protein